MEEVGNPARGRPGGCGIWMLGRSNWFWTKYNDDRDRIGWHRSPLVKTIGNFLFFSRPFFWDLDDYPPSGERGKAMLTLTIGSRFQWLVRVTLVLGLIATALPPHLVWAQSAMSDRSDGSTLLRLKEAQVKPGEAIDLDLVVVKAPEGVQRFHMRVVLEDPSVAQIQGVRGGVISGPFFQVISQTERSVEFRSVDLEDVINSKTEELVLATVTLMGMTEGATALNVEVELLVSDQGNRLAPSIAPGRLSVVSVSTPATPTPSPQVGPSPVVGYDKQPRDLDSDGVYEDFDGDGQFTAKDVALFAYYVDREMIQSNQRLFDANGDGDANIDDALMLAASLTELSSLSLPIFRLEEKTVPIVKDADLDIVLDSAPGGLQWYDITILVEDSNIAQVGWVEARAIDGRFFEVVRQTADSIEFRAVDLKDEVPPGTKNLSLATISLTTVEPGHTAVWMIVNPLVDDQGKDVAPIVRCGGLTYTIFTVGSSSSPPKDLDGDGLFEDINGDGKVTFEDVRLFGFNVSSRVVQENWRLFDFDRDGDADFDDARAFAQLVEEGSPPT